MEEDWFIRYPKIYRVGHKNNRDLFSAGKVYIEEKVDGANVRFGKYKDSFRYGSRKRELTNITDEKDLGQFVGFVDWVKNFEGKVKDGYIYFGEYMIPHTIQYDWTRVPKVLGFDIWDIENKRWLSYEEKVEEFKRIGVPVVPLVDMRDVQDIGEKYLESIIPESKYYNGKAEGVVFKNYDLQIFGKLVAKEFKERNEDVFGKPKKWARKESGERYLLEKYVPPRKVEKVIQSLVDNGMELDMTLMKELPRAVLDDIIAEEGYDIFRENVAVDFRKFRKMIAKRCVNVLQRVLAMKSIEERRNI